MFFDIKKSIPLQDGRRKETEPEESKEKEADSDAATENDVVDDMESVKTVVKTDY